MLGGTSPSAYFWGDLPDLGTWGLPWWRWSLMRVSTIGQDAACSEWSLNIESYSVFSWNVMTTIWCLLESWLPIHHLCKCDICSFPPNSKLFARISKGELKWTQSLHGCRLWFAKAGRKITQLCTSSENGWNVWGQILRYFFQGKWICLMSVYVYCRFLARTE